MSVDLTFQLNTQQAISAHLLNPETTCLAFRDRQWTVIPKDQSSTVDQNFFARWMSPAQALSVETYGNVQLCFEALSLNNINETFEETALEISRLFTQRVNPASSFDEGYSSSNFENLLGRLNFLKTQIVENETTDYQAQVLKYAKEFDQLPRAHEDYENCKALLISINKILTKRSSSAPAAAAAAELPVVETGRTGAETADRIAHIRANRAAIQQRLDLLNREIDQVVRERKLETVVKALQDNCNALIRLHSAYDSQVGSFTICDRDPGASVELINETVDLQNYEAAERVYHERKTKFTDLKSSLERALAEATHAKNGLSEDLAALSREPAVITSLQQLESLLKQLNGNIQHLDTIYGPSIESSSGMTKIKQRYQQRRKLLAQATQAITECPKKSILLSVVDGRLTVEEKPLIEWGKNIETITLSNGINVSCKKESRAALEKLFALAIPPRSSSVSDRYLADAREEFLGALASKT